MCIVRLKARSGCESFCWCCSLLPNALFSPFLARPSLPTRRVPTLPLAVHPRSALRSAALHGLVGYSRTSLVSFGHLYRRLDGNADDHERQAGGC